jgi:hypothetical protein
MSAAWLRHLPETPLADQKESKDAERELLTVAVGRDERQEIMKEVIGVHGLPARSLFGGGILRRLLLRVSVAKPTSALLRF